MHVVLRIARFGQRTSRLGYEMKGQPGDCENAESQNSSNPEASFLKHHQSIEGDKQKEPHNDLLPPRASLAIRSRREPPPQHVPYPNNRHQMVHINPATEADAKRILRLLGSRFIGVAMVPVMVKVHPCRDVRQKYQASGRPDNPPGPFGDLPPRPSHPQQQTSQQREQGDANRPGGDQRTIHQAIGPREQGKWVGADLILDVTAASFDHQSSRSGRKLYR